MATRIQLRRDTAANWVATNPILADGEIGINKTNDNFKIGDGVNAWNDLEYYSTGGGGGIGDMLKAIYDPQGIESDTFNMDNMVEGLTNLILKAEEREIINSLSSVVRQLTGLTYAGSITFTQSGTKYNILCFELHIPTGAIAISLPDDGVDGDGFILPIDTGAISSLDVSAFRKGNYSVTLDGTIYWLIAKRAAGEWLINSIATDIPPRDLTAPLLTSSIVENATPSAIDLTFDEVVIITTLGWTAEYSTDGGTIWNLLTINSVSGSGTDTPIFAISETILGTWDLRISYDSSIGDTTDNASTPNELADITNRIITNNVSAALLSLQTTSVTPATFNPSITASGGVAEWDLDGTVQNTNTPSIVFPNPGTKDILMSQGTIPNITNITLFLAENKALTGIIDFSQLTGLTTININTNSGLTGFALAPNLSLVYLQLNGTNVTSLPLSGLTQMSGQFSANAPILTFSFPSLGNFTTFVVQNWTYAGTLDLSDVGTCTTFTVTVCNGITSLTLPSGAVTTLTGQNNNALTTLLGSGYISTATGTLNFFGCALNQVSVDKILSDLQAYFSVTPPTKNILVNLNGGTSSAPSASGLTNKGLIQGYFTSAGFTATINNN